MRPSELCQIRSDIFAMIAFEMWDDTTKLVVQSYMKTKGLSYTAADYLDDENHLKILIDDNGKNYTIIV